jgi:hypothetical protein
MCKNHREKLKLYYMKTKPMFTIILVFLTMLILDAHAQSRPCAELDSEFWWIAGAVIIMVIAVILLIVKSTSELRRPVDDDDEKTDWHNHG